MNVFSRIEQTLLVCDFLRGWTLLELVAQLDALAGDDAKCDGDVGRSTLAQTRHEFLRERKGTQTELHPPVVVAVADPDVAGSIHASPPAVRPAW